MVVKFYKTSSDPLQLNKYLTNELELTVQTTDDVDIENPTFLLDLTEPKMNRNYAYVPAWGKYYFLREPQVINGHQIEVSGTVDVLMSNRSAILNAQIIADRSASDYENYMEDNLVSDSGKIITKIRKLPTVFNTQTATNNYVLILGGK